MGSMCTGARGGTGVPRIASRFVDGGMSSLNLHYDSFKAYAKDRHDIGKRYANQLMAASAVVVALEAGASCSLPANEGQVRPLLKLETVGP